MMDTKQMRRKWRYPATLYQEDLYAALDEVDRLRERVLVLARYEEAEFSNGAVGREERWLKREDE